MKRLASECCSERREAGLRPSLDELRIAFGCRKLAETGELVGVGKDGSLQLLNERGCACPAARDGSKERGEDYVCMYGAKW